ncbi:hypothetical protein B566_EDAN001786 [Ephemera danica]|nr:hypothetical protein B566_EDAN001786 [Ephemera danica]
MARSLFSKIDEYGFERPDDFDYKTYEDFMSTYLGVLARRARKWAALIGDKRTIKRCLTVKRYVRKGIPSEHRGHVWMTVSGAEILKQSQPDLYNDRLHGKVDEEIIASIRVDLPRTFPDNINYRKTAELVSAGCTQLQSSQPQLLYNILVAYAHDNEDVGYCQGLNYIAGLLLMATGSEESSFWLLKILVDRILPGYYNRSMSGIVRDINVLAELVKIKIPEVHQHVTNLGLPWAVITTKWFVCLFAEVLPVETVLRIWDCLFYEGAKIIFRVALTLIARNAEALLNCDDFTSLATCFKDITHDALVTNCHDFMQSIFKVPGSLPNSTIRKLREQFDKTEVS